MLERTDVDDSGRETNASAQSSPAGGTTPERDVVEGDVVDTQADGSADARSTGGGTAESLLAAKGRAAMAGLSWWVGLVSLVVLCLIAFLPGWTSLPPVDRDESRFAQASRQMLASGDWVVPMVQDRPRLNKPPLIYWLQASSSGAFTLGQPLRDSIWMYRLPSIIAGVMAVVFSWKLGLAMFDSRTARLAGALLALCPIMIWEAKQARADMVLLALTTGAMLTMWRILVASREEPAGRPAFKLTVLFWILIAAGIMVKGPITPMVVGLTALAYAALTRQWRWLLSLKPALGLVILAALVGPWVWAVASRIGWNEYVSIILDETLGRSAGAKEGHWGPPGYHTLLLPVLFWPGSMLTAAGLTLAIQRVRSTPKLDTRSTAHPDAFLLAWIVPSWLVFELVSTKLPHYTMPMLPAIAIVSARAVLAADANLIGFGARWIERLGQRIWLVLGLGLTVILPILALSSAWRDLGTLRAIIAIVLIGLTLVYFSQATRAILARRAARAQLAGAVGMLLTTWILIGVLLPGWDRIWITPRLHGAIAQIDSQGIRPIAAVDYQEDSLIFESRGRVERVAAAALGDWMTRHPTGLAIVNEPPGANSSRLRTVGTVEGFNYSKGRSVVLHIVEAAP